MIWCIHMCPVEPYEISCGRFIQRASTGELRVWKPVCRFVGSRFVGLHLWQRSNSVPRLSQARSKFSRFFIFIRYYVDSGIREIHFSINSFSICTAGFSVIPGACQLGNPPSCSHRNWSARPHGRFPDVRTGKEGVKRIFVLPIPSARINDTLSALFNLS